jgi:protein involved in polysaccharide export with SLBB domain
VSTQDALALGAHPFLTQIGEAIKAPVTLDSRMLFQNQCKLAFIAACISALHAGTILNAQEVPNEKTRAVSNSPVEVGRNATLRPGDHLKITVLSDDKDLSGEFEVAPDGTLKHPLYNRVQVAGVPVTALKEKIASFLRTFQKEPQLEVEPLFQITIAGEVNKPGVFFVAPETTVQKAIERDAGGTNDRANLNAVTLLRDSRRIPVRMAETSAPAEAQTIHSGDYIGIGKQRNIVGHITPFVGIGASLISLTVLIATHHR